MKFELAKIVIIVGTKRCNQVSCTVLSGLWIVRISQCASPLCGESVPGG